MRRQNHSCEQCRKAKKACDGYLVNSSRASFLDATARAQSGGPGKQQYTYQDGAGVIRQAITNLVLDLAKTPIRPFFRAHTAQGLKSHAASTISGRSPGSSLVPPNTLRGRQV